MNYQINVNILLPKLDKESRKLFESSLETSDVPKLDNFLNFLEKRSLVIESISRDPGVKGSKNATLPPRRYQSFLMNSRSLPKNPGKSVICAEVDEMRYLPSAGCARSLFSFSKS
ncbi:hypothetical protein AVEN_170974-1 [Araneus ventricosus]|uniref:Uncharacterized protein n=1 Tax=Araneus ventricosus TaxID=182803 RepID=A0A4Y2WFH7_ARAVE|nr:hypothetical protein AVEN_170974-1 [Araneus ventricosus]